MNIKIDIPSYLQPYINNMEAVGVNGNTVGQCLDHLIRQFPDIRKMLFAKNGKLHGYVGIYVNGEDAYPEDLTKPVKDGDEIYILYIIGGG